MAEQDRRRSPDLAAAPAGKFDTRKAAWLDLRKHPLEGVETRGPLHLPGEAAGAVSAVRVLAGDAVLRADALGGGPLLPAAGHGGDATSRSTGGRSARAVHADREQSERAHGARAQSELPRRALSVGGRARRRGAPGCSPTRASPCRSSTGRVLRARRRASRTGTSSCRATTTRRASLGQLRPGGARRRSSGEVGADAGDGGAAASACAPRSTTSIFYLGFNLLDPVVGGDSPSARASCARRSRSPSTGRSSSPSSSTAAASPAQGPIPPGIFGYREGAAGINPVVYDWEDGGPQRQPIEAATKLLAEAGYPDGRDARTGAAARALPRHRAARAGRQGRASTGGASSSPSSRCSSRSAHTDWNRFQEKMRKGSHAALHPRLERRLSRSGELPVPARTARRRSVQAPAARTPPTTQNPEYDALFERMKNMPNSPARQAIIDRMIDIVRQDAPWIWGFHPKDYGLRAVLAAQRQAEQDGAQQPEVPAHRRRAARAAAARVEPAGAVADRAPPGCC